LDCENQSAHAAVAALRTELKKLRRQSRKLLDQRTECFTFFHEALESVKKEIRERKRSRALQKAEESANRVLQSMGLRGATAHLKLPAIDGSSNVKMSNERVALSDLEPEDREKLLAILLEKMKKADERRYGTLAEPPKALPPLSDIQEEAGSSSTFITQQR